jgi:DNA-binding NtrC family response regulator
VAAILIVEDEEQVRVLAESFLRDQEGHAMLSAATVEQALALLEQSDPIDLLFTDIGMHGDLQAGLTLARKAVEVRPELQVLYTSGQGVTDGMIAMFVEGSAFLPKPYTAEQLKTILQIKFGIESQAK